ncbi:MAG TPA: undecaprenyl-diphosphate phosphatase [Syntrophomonas sp.]|nr:undecaprenyl-diphosphate phosphatase [Syntrophomonas sp.]
MSSLLIAVILGIVEGITEFLPISSTGHLILVNQLVEFHGNFAHIFDVVIQMGAILSVVVYFWRKLNPFSGYKNISEREETWDLWRKTLVALVPALLIGATLGKYVQKVLFNPLIVAMALIIGGIILVIIERRQQVGIINSINELSYKNSLLIGLIQCLAMIPGTSRSAATIIGAILLGASRSTAAEFSFFLAIPTMAAASAYSLLTVEASLTCTQWQIIFTGFVVAFLVAWAVIAVFMKYIQNHDFKPFGYYRIILGIVVLGISIFTK